MTSTPLVSIPTSRRITALRALMILMVIFVHASKGITFHGFSETPLVRQVYAVVYYHLFQVCVPIYFAIAAYLLFLRYDGNLREYPRMVARRFRSVMLPFLLLNAFWLGWLIVFGSIPGLGGTTVYRTRGFLNMLLGLDAWPFIYPLWFLRDLFVLFLLAPFFALLARFMPWLGLVGLWAAWNFVQQKGVPVEFSGAFFFYLGCLLARRKADLNAWQRFTWPLALLWAALIAGSTYFMLHDPGSDWRWPLWRGALLAGAISTWTLSGWPRRPGAGDDRWEGVGASRTVLAAAPLVFFVYLLHEPVMSYLIAWTPGLAKSWCATSLGQFAYSGLVAVSVGLFNLGLAWLLRRYVWPVYSLITGGR